VYGVPSEVKEPVFQPEFIRVVFAAGDLDGQHVRRRLDDEGRNLKLDLARREFGVCGAGGALNYLAGHGDHALDPQRFSLGKGRRTGCKNALGEAEMVAQIKEK
jgi:hypothetical protein